MNYINMTDYIKMQNPDVLTYDLGKYEATI